MSAGRPGSPRRGPAGGGQRGGIFFRLLALLLFLACAAALYLFRHPLLRALGDSLILDESPQRSDAIIVLSDDDASGERAIRAAQLYHAGWAPVVVASGRWLRSYASIADLMERDLRDHGVPPGAIVKFPHHADNTLEEAIALRGLCRERGWRRLLVVTSSFHTRRARYVFSRVLPPPEEMRVVSAPDFNFDPNSWWLSHRGIKIVFFQYVSVPVAVWELRQGSPASGGEH